MIDIPKKFKGQVRKDLLKIIQFARLAGLRGIAFSQNLSQYPEQIPPAYYSREDKTIFISENFNPKSIISILLHELGHHIEMNQRPFLFGDQDLLIDNQLAPKKPQELQKFIYHTEIEAWRMGEEVARFLKIKLPKDHNKIKKFALNSYKPHKS